MSPDVDGCEKAMLSIVGKVSPKELDMVQRVRLTALIGKRGEEPKFEIRATLSQAGVGDWLLGFGIVETATGKFAYRGLSCLSEISTDSVKDAKERAHKHLRRVTAQFLRIQLSELRNIVNVWIDDSD